VLTDLAVFRNIAIIETLKKCGLEPDPQDKKQFKGDGYRISVNGQKWYDHNAEKGGGGSIDLVCHVLECDFKSALEFLGNNYAIKPSNSPHKEEIIAASIIPAEQAKNWLKTRAYLIEERGLNPLLVDWCFDMQLIYADRYSNAVFKYGAGVELRGIYKNFKGSRGKASKPFSILYCSGKPISFAITESAIDCLSYRQMNKNQYCASIAGNSNDLLMEYCINLAIQHKVNLTSAFDNDAGGAIAHKRLLELVNERVIVTRRTPTLKDWNKELLNSQ